MPTLYHMCLKVTYVLKKLIYFSFSLFLRKGENLRMMDNTNEAIEQTFSEIGNGIIMK